MFGFFKRSPKKTQDALNRSRAGWLGRLTGLFQRGQLSDNFWDDLEETLIAADVGVETALSLTGRLREHARRERLDSPDRLKDVLRDEILSLLESAGRASLPWIEQDGLPRPYVIMVVGVNGAGKTTSIAKLAHHLKSGGKSVVLGCGDTFRAAASEQLQVWGQRIGIDVIAGRSGADPGSVAFDAYQSAKARNADFLIVDTAGRLHTNYNLMEELKKMKRVLGRLDADAPHQVLLVLDATTGHNGLAQARAFTEAVECSGVFLAKLDGTARGGVALVISKELGLPVLFIGTGEGLDDIAVFDPQEFVDALLAPA